MSSQGMIARYFRHTSRSEPSGRVRIRARAFQSEDLKFLKTGASVVIHVPVRIAALPKSELLKVKLKDA